MTIDRGYLESLSTENAACIMRASCATYNEISGEQLSIADNVTKSIDHAMRLEQEGINPELPY